MIGHGGNLGAASQETGIPEERLLDYSASINPLGVPESAVTAIRDNIGRLPHYPDPFAERLSDFLGRHLYLDPRTILCGNGSTELIHLVVRALMPRRVLIPAPTFSEYERACRMVQGVDCVRLKTSRENNFTIDPDAFIAAMAGCELAFLCNPNNPSGGLLERDAVLAIAQAARSLSCYLVVDEAFVDFVPDCSVVDGPASNPRLMVLRSLTKFYALAGLRIGFAVVPFNIGKRLLDRKEPWTVNSLAIQAGMAAIDDRQYRLRTGQLIAEEKDYLERGFRAAGIEHIPSAVNYYLLKMGNARAASAVLRNQGILVRDCSNFAGLDGSYIRAAVRSRKENEILLRELAALN